MRRIVQNRAQCRKCGDVISSRTRHDIHWCGCGTIGVDGGLAYLRRMGENLDMVIELSEYENTPIDSHDKMDTEVKL